MIFRVVALALAIVISYGNAPAAESAAEPAKCPASGDPAGTAEAIDGDTLRLADGRVVRLAGIEAPKSGVLGDPARSSGLADGAGSALSGLIAGKAVTLSLVGDGPDRHGRIHAFAYLPDGKMLQSEILGLGFALVHLYPGEDACAKDFLAAEAAARDAGRGLWAGPTAVIRKADDPSLRDEIGLYELVEGRVLSVGRRSRLVFLDFGRDWSSDFTVMLDKAAAESLAEAGISADSLAKRRIRVRGVIEDSGGPAMRIAEPSSIELLDETK